MKETGEGLTARENVYDRVLELLPKNKNIRILDAGCGIGNVSKRLLENGFKNILALDIENKLKIDIPFIKADLNKELVFEETFDVIICQELIEHLENPRHLLRELKKILNNEGIIILTTPNIFNWKARIYYPLKGLIWGFREEDYKVSGHITPVTRYDFERICSEVGLRIIQITYNNSNKEIFGDNLIVVVGKKGVKNNGK